MSRKRPTGRLSALDDQVVRLIVEYEGADDFLSDYDVALSAGEAHVETARDVADGTALQLTLMFPGLVEPIVIDGTASPSPPDAEQGVTVALSSTATSRLAPMAERIRNRDRRVVLPVVRVLLVEDNRHVSELIKNGLAASTRRDFRDVAFAFETADNGASALDVFRARQFEAAIVDIYLPVLDGSTLIRELRTSLGLGTLPIIAISGGGEAARNSALRAGASVFLHKPVRLRELVDTLRQWLG